MNRPSSGICLLPILRGRAQAKAVIKGSEHFPDIAGIVRIYQTNSGLIIRADISGLPRTDGTAHGRIFGFHIHEGTDCGSGMGNPFGDTMSHYNPDGAAHPDHAGDLPPLFGNNGTALSVFLTDRFSLPEIIGRTIVIHDHPDDFTTQPSGNSGTKIACGVILAAKTGRQDGRNVL